MAKLEKIELITKSDVIRYTNKLIRYGFSNKDIINKIVHNGYDNSLDEYLEDIVSDTCINNGQYDIIQKIMRSKLVIDMQSKDIRIVDPIKKDYIDITKENLHSIFNSKMDLNYKKFICKFIYDPYGQFIIQRCDSGYWLYNTYQPPEWISGAFYDNKPLDIVNNMPDIYNTFFNHLVDNDKDSYEYLIKWLSNGLKSRNFCILTSIGAQGVGKGVLGEIMRGLFGKENFFTGSDRVFKGNFNAQLRNKRLIYIDEITIKNKHEEDKLKLVVNEFIEVERKGFDSEELKNYSNFYVSSNSMDAIRLTADDRRFSVINLTDKKLIDIMSGIEIEELLKQENINILGKYLYNMKIDSEEMKRVFISKRTEEIRASVLKEWQDDFLDNYCIEHSGQTIKQTQVSDDIEEKWGAKFRPSRAGFKDLEQLYPNKFSVKKKNIEGKQVWVLEFYENC